MHSCLIAALSDAHLNKCSYVVSNNWCIYCPFDLVVPKIKLHYYSNLCLIYRFLHLMFTRLEGSFWYKLTLRSDRKSKKMITQLFLIVWRYADGWKNWSLELQFFLWTDMAYCISVFGMYWILFLFHHYVLLSRISMFCSSKEIWVILWCRAILTLSLLGKYNWFFSLNRIRWWLMEGKILQKPWKPRPVM